MSLWRLCAGSDIGNKVQPDVCVGLKRHEAQSGWLRNLGD